jgi:hypothetical protein
VWPTYVNMVVGDEFCWWGLVYIGLSRTSSWWFDWLELTVVSQVMMGSI